MSDAVRVRKRLSYSAVPDVVLEATWLSTSARLVLAWLLGRPDGWVIHISHMTRILGLTDKSWPRTRKELIASGFFVQERQKGEGGKFFWINEINDDPLYQDSSILPKRRDGKCSNAESGDIPIPSDQKQITTPHSPRRQREVPEPAPAGSRWHRGKQHVITLDPETEISIQDELQGRQEAASRGEAPPISNTAAWLARLRQRAAAGEDITTEHGKRVRVRREADARYQAALTKPPSSDMSASNMGEAMFASVRARRKTVFEQKE